MSLRRSERESRAERRLVTSGIPQRIWHPIYLAHLCMLLAWTLGSGDLTSGVLQGLLLAYAAHRLKMLRRKL